MIDTTKVQTAELILADTLAAAVLDNTDLADAACDALDRLANRLSMMILVDGAAAVRNLIDAIAAAVNTGDRDAIVAARVALAKIRAEYDAVNAAKAKAKAAR